MSALSLPLIADVFDLIEGIELLFHYFSIDPHQIETFSKYFYILR